MLVYRFPHANQYLIIARLYFPSFFLPIKNLFVLMLYRLFSCYRRWIKKKKNNTLKSKNILEVKVNAKNYKAEISNLS